MIDYAAQGRRNRRIGAEFERRVRKDQIEKGWIVDKFTCNIDLDNFEIVQAQSNKFNSRSCGFPDFVMWRKGFAEYEYELKFIECKTNNKLKKIEKQKLDWLIKQGHRCYVAFLDGKEIKYREFLGYEDKSGSVAKKSSRA